MRCERNKSMNNIRDLLAQCDLKGADSWTIACHCAALGDPTMLDDLRAGMKIQSILVLLYERGEGVNALDRGELKSLCTTTVNGDSWQYHACKMVLYGSSYGMAPDKMSEGILKNSYKDDGQPVYVPPATCKDIQERAMFVRYPGIRLWHKEWEKELIHGHGQLRSSVGHIRTFHGRKWDWQGGVRVVNRETQREALASEPQLITTYCIKLAQERCWYDEANRNDDDSLKVRPLLTVHDSFISRFDESLKEFARVKLHEWFDNPVTIAGITVTIPFAGTFGRGWDMKEGEVI